MNNDFRIGIGHDTHRLAAGRPLCLGGIVVPHDQGPVGHSDGDVLLHAITDALLGAAALGDIGELFPDTDVLNKDRNSADFVATALARIRTAGYTVGNLDCIVFLQRPKLGPYKGAIRERIAALLGLSLDQVSLKAKTGERVDAVGREEALMAQAIVLLQRIS